eukprot:2464637-Pyramimonas_sp.AAC.1
MPCSTRWAWRTSSSAKPGAQRWPSASECQAQPRGSRPQAADAVELVSANTTAWGSAQSLVEWLHDGVGRLPE